VLGAVVAAHLARSGQVRHLLLASRSGPAATGAARLAAQAAGAGAEVNLVACDAADRAELAGLLAAIPARHPLTGVIHSAGVLDDGVIPALTPERIDTVLRAKADAAVNLEELTAAADLATFVLFSSSSTTFGALGIGNYVAANAYLDALAIRRRARGLPAVSVGWGLWEQRSGMAARLDVGARARVNAGIMTSLDERQGLELYDAAQNVDQPVAVAVNLSLPALRSQAETEGVAPLFQELVPAAGRPGGGGAPAEDMLRRKLAGLTAAEQELAVLDVVRAQAAAVLGHASADAVPARVVFRDLGFDSLTAVDLRNRLGAATGLRLSASVVFDYPTPTALAQHLRAAMGLAEPAPSVLAELDKLEAALSAAIPAGENIDPDQVTARLEAILSRWKIIQHEEDDAVIARNIESATDEEVFDFIGQEFGIS
jgi:acyl carrier protein